MSRKGARLLSLVSFCLLAGTASAHAAGVDGGYVGTPTCLSCHDGGQAPDMTAFLQTGHPWIYRHTGGGSPGDYLTPLFPTPPGLDVDTLTLGDDCGEGLVACDAQGRLAWQAINDAVGGFGWKILWGVKDPAESRTGYSWSGRTQYNLRDGSWSAHDANQDRTYDCGACHQTNGAVFTYGSSCYTSPLAPNRTEPLSGNPGMSLEEIPGDAIGDDDTVCETGEACRIGGYRSRWTLDGVQCEACHGPGSNPANTGHVDAEGHIHQGVLTLPGGVEICARCHVRADNTPGMGGECGGDANPAILANGAPITGDFIDQHGQYNELHGLDGDGVHASLQCTDCHDPHRRATHVIPAVAAALYMWDNDLTPQQRGAVVACESCHPGKTLVQPMGDIACADCHMAEATRSAVSESTAGWGRKADVKSHLFRIETGATTITRSNGFTSVATNALSIPYACGKCHDATMGSYVGNGAMTLEQARSFAINIHGDDPTATFGYTLSGLTVNVDASASFCVSGSCRYDWNWGDGSAHATGAISSHAYAGPGPRTVTLTVKDAVRLGTDAKSVPISLSAPDAPPVVAGVCSFDANTWTEMVTDASTDDSGVAQVTVNWGDGSMLSNDTVAPFGPFSRTYLIPGTWTLTHKAIDTIGQQSTRTCTATPAFFTIGGTVRSPGGSPIGAATVTVKKGSSVVKTVTTAANGAFTAGNLKPAAYTLTVTRSPYTFTVPAAAVTVGPSQPSVAISATGPFLVDSGTGGTGGHGTRVLRP